MKQAAVNQEEVDLKTGWLEILEIKKIYIEINNLINRVI